MTLTKNLALLILALSFVALLSYLAGIKEPRALGSIIESQEYIATTTAPNNVFGATVSSSRIIKTGQGALGSVVITGANTGIVNFYNATTSDVSKRTGNPATTTILIASLPASLAAGTYVFDVAFTTGLFIDISGTVATSTVTYR